MLFCFVASILAITQMEIRDIVTWANIVFYRFGDVTFEITAVILLWGIYINDICKPLYFAVRPALLSRQSGMTADNALHPLHVSRTEGYVLNT